MEQLIKNIADDKFNRRVALTEVGGRFWVSTVKLYEGENWATDFINALDGINTNHTPFETLTKDLKTDEWLEDTKRVYCTIEEAEEGHREVVLDMVRRYKELNP